MSNFTSHWFVSYLVIYVEQNRRDFIAFAISVFFSLIISKIYEELPVILEVNRNEEPKVEEVLGFNNIVIDELPHMNQIPSNRNEGTLCGICKQKERDILFLPCRHLVACGTCPMQLVNCPVCFKKIEQMMRIYIA